MFSLIASAASPWPNTTPVLVLVCETRAPLKDGRVIYGANEFIIDKKVCRYTLEVKKPS